MKVYRPTEAKENGYMRELLCGKCGNILYGYDEDICPSCGAYNDFDNCITKEV